MSRLKSVNFGYAKRNLGSVGYTLLNVDGSIRSARSESGVFEAKGRGSTGIYASAIALPGTFNGLIIWDTGETTPRWGVEEYHYDSFGAGIGSSVWSMNPNNFTEPDTFGQRIDYIKQHVAYQGAAATIVGPSPIWTLAEKKRLIEFVESTFEKLKKIESLAAKTFSELLNPLQDQLKKHQKDFVKLTFKVAKRQGHDVKEAVRQLQQFSKGLQAISIIFHEVNRRLNIHKETLKLTENKVKELGEKENRFLEFGGVLRKTREEIKEVTKLCEQLQAKDIRQRESETLRDKLLIKIAGTRVLQEVVNENG